MIESDLTHGSLFSGIGGFELGADWAGIKTLWNCEIEKKQRLVLQKNFKDAIQFEDITKLKNPPYVNILSGGFPCQDISLANSKGKGIEGEKSGLWKEYFRVINEVRPQYAILENSPALLIRGMHTVITDLAKIGYGIEWQCLSASQFGFNHRRKRIYAVAYPVQKRCKILVILRRPGEVCFRKPSGKNIIHPSIERYATKRNNAAILVDDGFRKGLDSSIIEMSGNSVIPHIANYIFECIKIHNQLK